MVIKIIIATTILLSVGISYYTGSKKKNRRLDFNPTRSWQLVSDGALLIDVRTTKEYEEGHADGALHIPYDQLEQSLSLIESQTKGNKDAPIVLYCRSGNRSGIGKKTLQKMGYTNVMIHGGLDSWQGPKKP